jgi:GntR family transcriptional regulator/MocR family aminotransferase
VWVEDPGYHGARGALAAAGATLVPVPVDDEGLVVDAALRRAPRARLACVTPTRQLPLGVPLAGARRRQLLAWATDADAWVVEDDYDSEFHYAERPLPALRALDAGERVLYVGTFSKVMFPALRLGYLVVPAPLVDAAAAVRQYMDYSAPYLEQAVMADFLADGHFERHIRRMRRVYAGRRAVLLEAVERELGGALRVGAAEGGLHVVGRLADGLDDGAVARAAGLAGVEVLPLGAFALREPVPPALLLGFAGVDEVQLRDGVRRLARVLDGSRIPALGPRPER